MKRSQLEALLRELAHVLAAGSKTTSSSQHYSRVS